MKLILFAVMIFINSNPVIKQSSMTKIPITTTSKEALLEYEKGWLLEDRIELKKAELHYQNAVKEDTTFALAYLRLAMIQSDFNKRKSYLEKSMQYIHLVSKGEQLWINGRIAFYLQGNSSNEFQFFKELIELYPDDERARYLFGYMNHHHGRNNIETSILYLKKAIEINPNFIKPYDDLAYAYIENKDFESSEKIIKQYIEILPESLTPHEIFAEMLMRSGQYSRSIDAYNGVLELDSAYAWAIMGIAANLNFLNRHIEARRELNKLEYCELTDREYRLKWRARVVSYIDEGKLDSAILILDQQKNESLSNKNKREPFFHIYYSFLRKTKLHFENNQPPKGIQEYKKWNDFIQSKIPQEKVKKLLADLSHFYKAYQAYINGDVASSNQFLDQYNNTIDETNDNYRVLKSKLLIKEKKYTEAITMLKASDISNPYNQYWLAEAYRLNGEENKAQELYKKAASLNEMNEIDYALIRSKAIHRITD